MAIPRLVFGASLGVLLAPDLLAFDDDGVAYAVLALTNTSAPAGPSGECIFPMLYLTTKRFGSVEITVTPIVDEIALASHVITLVGGSAAGVVEVTEIDLSTPYPSALDPQIMLAPRGSSVQIQVDAPVTARVDVTVLQVEYEVVRESRLASA